MNKIEYKFAFNDGYEKALADMRHNQHMDRMMAANEDPTGQDLDDFIEQNKEEDDASCGGRYDSTQSAEMRFGA
jgi:hypothetical protein